MFLSIKVVASKTSCSLASVCPVSVFHLVFGQPSIIIDRYGQLDAGFWLLSATFGVSSCQSYVTVYMLDISSWSFWPFWIGKVLDCWFYRSTVAKVQCTKSSVDCNLDASVEKIRANSTLDLPSRKVPGCQLIYASGRLFDMAVSTAWLGTEASNSRVTRW